jgi:hypothetical protein
MQIAAAVRGVLRASRTGWPLESPVIGNGHAVVREGGRWKRTLMGTSSASLPHRARSAPGQVAGAATEKHGLEAHRPKRRARLRSPQQESPCARCPASTRLGRGFLPERFSCPEEELFDSALGSVPLAGRAEASCRRSSLTDPAAWPGAVALGRAADSKRRWAQAELALVLDGWSLDRTEAFAQDGRDVGG